MFFLQAWATPLGSPPWHPRAKPVKKYSESKGASGFQMEIPDLDFATNFRSRGDHASPNRSILSFDDEGTYG